MQAKLCENISKYELGEIKRMIGEAFVTNELFHEFGDINTRKELVLRYMDIYLDYVYESGALYTTDDRKGAIGFISSKKAPVFPQVKMLIRLLFAIPFKNMKRFLGHVKQISNSNSLYASKPHIDILFVCVNKECQGNGYAKFLVQTAKEYAVKEQLPLLFDTDMEKYARIYEHYGCELYNQTTASNGITRYNLVWKGEVSK